MSIINEVIKKVNAGIPLDEAIPLGADVKYWQRIIANPPKPKARPAYRPSRKAKRNTISSVLAQDRQRARATAELLARKNSAQDNPRMSYVEYQSRQQLFNGCYPDFDNGVS